jgi:hypothetical protein
MLSEPTILRLERLETRTVPSTVPVHVATASVDTHDHIMQVIGDTEHSEHAEHSEHTEASESSYSVTRDDEGFFVVKHEKFPEGSEIIVHHESGDTRVPVSGTGEVRIDARKPNVTLILKTPEQQHVMNLTGTQVNVPRRTSKPHTEESEEHEEKEEKEEEEPEEESEHEHAHGAHDHVHGEHEHVHEHAHEHVHAHEHRHDHHHEHHEHGEHEEEEHGHKHELHEAHQSHAHVPHEDHHHHGDHHDHEHSRHHEEETHGHSVHSAHDQAIQEYLRGESIFERPGEVLALGSVASIFMDEDSRGALAHNGWKKRSKIAHLLNLPLG